MRILALNCGSSSIKSALIDVDAARTLLEVRAENIGTASARLHAGGAAQGIDANASFDKIAELVLAEYRARLPEGPPQAIAHRIVHGGEAFLRPTRLDDDVLRKIGKLDTLAPLHNPPALAAVRRARSAFPDVPHVAVFDTAFHSTLPKRAREYALPPDLRRRLGIRRYGFHGINHAHVMDSVAAHLRVQPHELRIISCHLGNGASVTAIEYGRSVETSMGMTPLEGLVMGTRPGDVDPGVLLHMLHSGDLDARQLDELLNEKSGLIGLTGTNDMRQIEQRAAEDDEECRLAIAVYSHRVRKYIGAYAAIMGGTDVIAFTGGIGENSVLVRHHCAQRLEFLGAVLDEDRNRDAKLGPEQPIASISEESSRTRLMVVRADEELAIARQTAALLSGKRSTGRCEGRS